MRRSIATNAQGPDIDTLWSGLNCSMILSWVNLKKEFDVHTHIFADNIGL